MIKPALVFTSGHYHNPASAPATEREAATTVQLWLRHFYEHNPRQPLTMIPVAGPNEVTTEEYRTIRETLRRSPFPCPIGVLLNKRCIMWAQDERALPDTLEHARATLQCYYLALQSCLPL